MIKEKYRAEFAHIEPDTDFLIRLEREAVRAPWPARRRIPRRLAAAIAAILILTLASTAVAVARGNLLRELFFGSGAADIAQQVQEVHAGAAKDGFCFTIDEVVWEGEELYLSYTAAVPDDGETYLLALPLPALNGEAMVPGSRPGAYIDGSFGALTVIGGIAPNCVSQVVSFTWTQVEADTGDQIEAHPAFLRALRPVEVGEDCAEREAYGAGEALRCFRYSRNGELVVCVEPYPEVQAAREAHRSESESAGDFFGQAAPELTPEMLAEAGLGEIAFTSDVTARLDAAAVEQTEFRGLAQNRFAMDGYTLEIRDFRLNHFHAELEATVYKDEGFDDGGFDSSNLEEVERMRIEDFDPFYGDPLAREYALLRPDGTPLCASAVCSREKHDMRAWGGLLTYGFTIQASDVIPLAGLDSLLLAPLDAGGDPVMDEAVTLTLLK